MNGPTASFRRIHVIGNSCAGKSTLARSLGTLLDVPVVDLDALNWLPDWIGLNATDPARLEARIAEATAGDEWILAGSYRAFCERVCWDRLQTLIWLDPPLPVLLRRMVLRSWQRWRTRELLWGTNRERFWPQFAVWRREDALLWWIVTQQAPKRRAMLEVVTDPRWRHVQVLRLARQREIEMLLADLASAEQAP